MKNFSFLIVAGGGGSRIGGLQKQFRDLGGRPLWRWSVDLACSLSGRGIEEIVLVLPQDHTVAPQALPSGVLPLKTATGGATRPDSVRNGLELCSCDFVLVHDAARPFASAALLENLMRHTDAETGAVPVLPVAEALKRIEGKAPETVSAVDREGLFTTQTPQSFPKKILARVLREHGASVKDEAEAWLAAGLELRCLEGERLNFKVTWPEDLRLAESLIQEPVETRTGLGYDVHRLVPERALILGGVVVASPLGLLGHSDADILAHTVADALLGAAGLDDIGNLFPASDARYRDADSMALLSRVVTLVEDAHWSVAWVDLVVEAQIPRLNAFLPEIRERLARCLRRDGAPCVNVKAKSPEKTGDAGIGRSMSCWAVATLRRMKPGALK